MNRRRSYLPIDICGIPHLHYHLYHVCIVIGLHVGIKSASSSVPPVRPPRPSSASVSVSVSASVIDRRSYGYRRFAPTFWCIAFPRPHIARRNPKGAPDKAVSDISLHAAIGTAFLQLSGTFAYSGLSWPPVRPFLQTRPPSAVRLLFPFISWRGLAGPSCTGCGSALVATSPGEVVLISPLASRDLNYQIDRLFHFHTILRTEARACVQLWDG